MSGLVIGLHLCGNMGWLGGVHYIHNAARALFKMPMQERPLLKVYTPRGVSPDLLADLASLASLFIEVRGQSLWTIAKDLRVAGFHALEGTPLHKVVSSEGQEVLFPIQETLGMQFRTPWIGWIPDLQHLEMPENFALPHRLARNLRLRRLVRDAPAVVVSSQIQLEALRGFVHMPSRAIMRVLQFAAVPSREWFERDIESALAQYDLPKRYFLVANQFWQHKNHEDVFRAVRLLRDEGHPVVVVCTGAIRDPRNGRYVKGLVRFVGEHNLQGVIRMLGRVPRQDGLALMRGSSAVIQPSRYEGWSTVVEEGRALGKAMVLSDIAVHKEQAPPEALYYRPGHAEELAELMKSLWQRDSHGHSELGETSALGLQEGRVVQYARNLVGIAREVSESSYTRA